jgi:hypothetical protein
MDAEPSIYGRVTKDGGEIIAQYWFYWVFNQWNDVHESDWEMIQLHFGTDDIDTALRKGPTRYAYAQHEGVEVAEAGDGKVRLVDGTHPLVYSSGGSHASYYASTRWFGKSGATGFGCDDTTGPTERITPEVIALPREAPTDGEFAWLSYQGRWGERQRLFDNGPTGPAAKDRWTEPQGWVEEHGRAESVELPFARSGATSTFCSLSATGSSILNRFLDEPVLVVVVGVALVVGVVATVRFGSRGVVPRAARTWWQGRRRYLLLSAVTFAIGVLALLAQYAVVELTVLGRLVDVVGGSSPWVLPLVALAGAVVAVPLLAWMIVAAMLVEHEGADVPVALRRAVRTDRSAQRAAMVLVVLFGLTLFVFPLAVVLASVWLVAAVASAREGIPARASLARSRRLLAGRRWRSLALSVTLCLILAVAGVLGALVLLATSSGFFGAALVVAAANGVLIPFVALVVMRYYEEVAPDVATVGVR